jgi:hypothetical protein
LLASADPLAPMAKAAAVTAVKIRFMTPPVRSLFNAPIAAHLAVMSAADLFELPKAEAT